MFFMKEVSELIKSVREFAAMPGWSRTRLARESGLSPNALRDLFEDDFNTTTDTLQAVIAFISSSSESKTGQVDQ